MKALGIPETLYHPISRLRFIAPDNSATFDFVKPVTCVMDVRGVFQFLGERAAAAGARIMVGTTAVEPILHSTQVVGVKARSQTRKDFQIESRILVDATGYRATIMRHVGVHPSFKPFKRFGVGAEYDLYAPKYNQEEALLIVGSQVAPAGYAWLFPWGRGRVRVGVGIIHTDSSAHPDSYLDALVENAGSFGVDLRGAQPLEYHFGLIPSEGLAQHFAGDGVMAVGDAACQSSALVGEGIRWAIKAGRVAGEVAAEAVAAGDFSKEFLARYETRWKSKFGRNLGLAYALNRKIAGWDDAKWSRKTELLKVLTAQEFGRALGANFSAGWALHVLFSHPRLLKEGFRQLGS